MAANLEPFAANLKNAQSHLDSLKEKRRADSENLQKWLFSNFRLLNARGESKSLSEIFVRHPYEGFLLQGPANVVRRNCCIPHI